MPVFGLAIAHFLPHLTKSLCSPGWFGRGVMPWMDLIQLERENGTVVNSYHRFWSFILSGGSIMLGVVLIGFLNGK
jgi:hypothetical protein